MATYSKTSPLSSQQDLFEGQEGMELTVHDDGSIEIEFESEEPQNDEEPLLALENDDDDFYKNLVEDLDQETLDHLSSKVLEAAQEDDISRQEWLDTIEFGLDLIGVKVEEKTVPFEGACSAQHPLLMESAVKFQSKASNEILPSDGPVKTKVLGDFTVEKEEQANRVKNHMNYQIMEEMTEFIPDTERMLLYVGLVGSGFKKTYYSSYYERPVSEFVPADQLIVPNSASDLVRAPRYTHVLYKTKYQLDADCAAGLYHKPPEEEGGLGDPSQPVLTSVQQKTQELIGVDIGIGEGSHVYTLYEQHVDCYIEGLDPYNEDQKYQLSSPYIITVDYASRKVIGVRRNWKKEDQKRKKKVMFTHYSFVPGFGFYSFGYLHLLGNIQLTLTAALRSLVDAGQFANLQGGFKLKGVRIVDDGGPIMPGQFKEIESHVQDIDKAIKPLPFRGADQTLYAMLEFLDAKGQKFADSTEQVIADSTNYGPVGTTLALLDASTKFFSSVHKRLHASLKNELKIIASINAETLAEDSEYNIENSTQKISRSDYDDRVDVVPVSDPNVSSSAHRMAKAQTILQVAMQNPALHDMREVLKHFYTNMDYAAVDKILPKPEEATPNDPLTDIKLASEGKPIKAFPGQEHQAHITVKQAFLQDPFSGGSPAMQRVAAQISANIQEHMLLNFIEQTQAQMQNQGQQVSPDALAQAASQVAQANQKKLMDQQNQAQAQDPQAKAALMLAEAEMLDTQTQAKKQNFDEKFKVAELELEKEKINLQILQELRKTQEFNQKLAHEVEKIVTTKSLDAMIEGMSNT